MSGRVQVSVGVGELGTICVWIDEGEVGVHLRPVLDEAGRIAK